MAYGVIRKNWYKEPSMKKPRIMFEDDGRHVLVNMYEPPMQKAEYESAVDELVGTPVEALIFNLGDGRTVHHDTAVGEVWGHNVEHWPDILFRRVGQNARALIDAGNDPLRVLCERAHATGMLLYPSLIAQQPTNYGGSSVSNFRLQNRHLEIGAAGDLDSEDLAWEGLDYKHQEVRDERFALIHETLTKYDVDGFELNLIRSPEFFYYFHPNEIDVGREIMTKWIASVYEAVKKSGPDRELCIRVPASLEACVSQGLDIQEWIRQGIVDVIIGETFTLGSLIDPLADFSEFVDAVKGSDCRFHATIHSKVDSDRLAEATITVVRATATNYWAQGVDGILLGHWFGNWPYEASFYEKLREVPYPEVMDARDKFYHIPTSTRRYPAPHLVSGLTMQLPADLHVGEPVDLDLMISDDLPRWDAVGRVHDVLLRFRVSETTELDRLTFALNGKELPDRLLRKINQMYTMEPPRYYSWGYWFIYHLDRDHWPLQGHNTLTVTLHERDYAPKAQIHIRDVELEIKYLMGKNFHREFVDDELGPHEGA
jgi:hypothetical protein